VKSHPKRYTVFNWLIYYWLREVLPEFRSHTYVELGGGGELLAILAGKVRAVTAVDLSEEALKRCRHLLGAKRNASCIQSDLFEYSPSSPHDVAMSFGVIEHFDEDKMIESVKAHARCAGKYVVIGVPSAVPRNWWRAVRNLEEMEFPPWKPMDVPDLWRLFEGAGIAPLAATRLDPTYGRHGPYWRAYRLGIRLGLLRKRTLNHPAGGLALMIGRVGQSRGRKEQ
jgi:cyclopropane fatty-acyl-phospholipid synthase-like methyltransferase